IKYRFHNGSAARPNPPHQTLPTFRSPRGGRFPMHGKSMRTRDVASRLPEQENRPMPLSSPLLNHMYTRFREVFGQPNTMLELDSQWTLRPDADPLAPALFLMGNGCYEKPAVWVFDPYDGGDNVWRTAVEAEGDVD